MTPKTAAMIEPRPNAEMVLINPADPVATGQRLSDKTL
jgi:hypothetical protein